MKEEKTGTFFRDETTITGGTGDSIKHIVYSGERVQQNAALAVVYADEQALMLSRELDPLENRISLLETALSVTEIASKIGYENPNKFTSAFKEMYGSSPTEYRKSVRLDRNGPYGVAKKSELY